MMPSALPLLQPSLMSEHARQAAQEFRDALQSPFSSLEELCQALAAPLHAFNLTSQPISGHQPEGDNSWLSFDAQDKAYIIKVYWSQFQEILATKVAVDWLQELRKAQFHETLWLPFFCPAKASDYVLLIARLSLRTLLTILGNKPARQNMSSSSPIRTALPEFVRETCMSLLVQLIKQYPISEHFTSIHSRSSRSGEALLEWQAFVDLYYSIPARVSNALSGGEDVTIHLEWRRFYLSLSRDLEHLFHVQSSETDPTPSLPGLSYALAKMARSGFMLFESTYTTFWSAVLPKLRHPLLSQSYNRQLAQLWQLVIASLSTSDFRTFVLGLITALEDKAETDATPERVKQASMLLMRLIGPARSNDERTFRVAVRGVFLSRAWRSTTARTLVSWIVGSHESDSSASAKLLDECLEVWAEKDVIEKAPVAYHTYLTSVLLLTLRSMPALDKSIVEISRSATFLTAITTHLSTMRETVRLQGMLVAEEVSMKSLDPDGSIKPLDFGDIWQEAGSSYVEIRNLKKWLDESNNDSQATNWELIEGEEGAIEEPEMEHKHTAAAQEDWMPSRSSQKSPSIRKAKGTGLIQVLDATSEYDDYDEIDEPDLQPYILPPKPSAQDLKDIDDLSAYTPEKKRAKPPIYIPDLCAYLKSEDANKLDVGLKEAAGLIRRKARWGTELADAAVQLVYILSGLQDNFNLDQFEERRRQALAALIASVPEKAAPAIIEQFFSNQYSIHQKTTMLASVAFGARELAGMPVLLPSDSLDASSKQAFPTQKLPDKLHDRFLKKQQSPESAGKELQLLTEDITNMALSRTRESTESELAQASKEKLLTVRETRRKVVAMPKAGSQENTAIFPVYNELAATTFIMPLLNRFWLYLRDVTTSPQDFRVGVFKGGSAGSVLLLEPLLLSKFISTVTVLVESARHSPHFLAVLAPEALELMLAIRGMNADDEAVQTSMLQLALIVLDGSISVDAGRTMAREHSKALWQLKDWAESVWAGREGRGEIGSVGRAAAGVLLRVDTVIQKTIGYV